MSSRFNRISRSWTALIAVVSSAMLIPSTANPASAQPHAADLAMAEAPMLEAPMLEAPTLEDSAIDFIAAHEDVLDYMYPDRTSVATAAGNNITLAQAQSREWLRPDGSRASSQDIAANYRRVASLIGTNSRAERSNTSSALRLSPQSQRAMAEDHLETVLPSLRRKFANFDDLPMNVQIGAISMEWALGGRYNRRGFPKHFAAIERGDWQTAARESNIRNVSKVANAQNFAMFSDASQMVQFAGAFESREKRQQLAAVFTGKPYTPRAVQQAPVALAAATPVEIPAPVAATPRLHISAARSNFQSVSYSYTMQAPQPLFPLGMQTRPRQTVRVSYSP